MCGRDSIYTVLSPKKKGSVLFSSKILLWRRCQIIQAYNPTSISGQSGHPRLNFENFVFSKNNFLLCFSLYWENDLVKFALIINDS